jgi:hypothetical protein
VPALGEVPGVCIGGSMLDASARLSGSSESPDRDSQGNKEFSLVRCAVTEGGARSGGD